jgi:hypothetical protein
MSYLSIMISRVIGIITDLDSQKFAGKSVRHRGSNGDQGNSIDGVLETDEAPKVTGHVTGHCGHQTNVTNGNDKARVAS